MTGESTVPPGSRAGRRRPERALSISRDDGVVGVGGELDISTAPVLSEALEPAVERGGVVTLDVRDLAFMDSSGLRLLIEAARRLEGRGKLVLRSPGATVRRVLEVSGVIGQLPTLEVEGGDPAPAS